MEFAVELLVGLALASCAGLRAWLPLLLVGLLAQRGYLELHPGFAFLGRPDALVVFSTATVVEVLGDKFPLVDHCLDAIGAVVRPAAGAVLLSAMFVSMDPLLSLALGLMLGGGVAFTVNAGKALVRAKLSALMPAHGGLGNSAVSLGEDLLATLGVALVALAPWLAGLLALFLVLGSAWLVVVFVRSGGRILEWLWKRSRRTSAQS
ncbi:MAG: DUF4126 domain-containing protein [Candidatus Xenobium sp.]|jgi:hypothetical protein|nr:DUF4126 domain-containing protein [Burkholderiales bacterium]